MRTAINSVARLQRVWGAVAGRRRLDERARNHGEPPASRLETERRTDFGRLSVATGAGPAGVPVSARSQRAGR